MPDDSTDSPSPRRRGRGGRLLLLAVVIAAAAAGAWWWKQQTPEPVADPALSPEALDARLIDAEQAVTRLRSRQSVLEQKIDDTASRTTLLRDEMLGLGQRAAILEDNLRELAAQSRDGRETLRLDEVELLLGLAQARLRIAGDIEGAIRATALAREAMTSLTAPRYISLRQTIGQELAALQALPADPRRQAAGVLDALQATLPQLVSRGPGEGTVSDPDASAWQRLVDAVVQVRPSGPQDLVAPGDRATGEATLALELALARTALDRGDASTFRAGLARVEDWLVRLYADEPRRQALQKQLAELRALSLQPALPGLGAALEQVRALRGTSPGVDPLRAAAATADAPTAPAPEALPPPIAPPDTGAGADAPTEPQVEQ
ncbi:uroporphyrinogen-III C-methyltransferase [Arenimonas composti]|uniref:uroporphyrinogen-III C-methyltransferase n=1 Tax=Arenimonas composti TaxID=370776 RepID=UPI001FE0D7A6|nr:uroporphyrinogen-III C-methyltransferase [Arenimonas composti]